MWKVFRLVLEKEMGEKLDPKINRSIHKVRRLSGEGNCANSLQVLRSPAKKHGLSYKKRVNRCMAIDDLEDQIETAVTTTEKTFDLSKMRILVVLFLLLLAPSGSRPMAILRLRFGDVRVVLARGPERRTTQASYLIFTRVHQDLPRHQGCKCTPRPHLPCSADAF